MYKSKIDQILSLASSFEKRAALKFDSRFIHELHSLIGILPTGKDFSAWVEKNASIFSQIPFEVYSGWLTNYLDHRKDANKYLRTSGWDNSKDKEQFVYIGKSSAEPNTLDVARSALLQGHGAIPNLWLFVGELNTAKGSDVAKEFAHEAWLMEALSDLIYGHERLSPDLIEEFPTFFQKNKSKIDNIRKHFEGTPKILGAGADGVALSVNKNLVLKLFKDKHSFEQAQNAVERLHKHPELAKTEAMIYDVGVLGDILGYTIYYYLIEKMKPVYDLGDRIPDALSDIKVGMRAIISRNRAYWKTLKALLADPSKHSELKDLILRGAQELVKETKLKNNVNISLIERELGDKLKPTWLDSFAEELLMKNLTGREDLHMGNVGLTGYGEFRYFDPVYGPYRTW